MQTRRWLDQKGATIVIAGTGVKERIFGGVLNCFGLVLLVYNVFSN